MSTDHSDPSFGDQIRAFFRFILRLIFVLVLAIGLGIGVYYGATYAIPELYRRYIQPVEDNTLRLNDLEASQAQEIQQLTERIEALNTRLTELEAENDTNNETISILQSSLATAESQQASQADLIATLEPAVSDFAETQSELEAIQTTLDALSESVDEYSQQVSNINADDQAWQDLLAEMQLELELLRAMEFLTRGRLFLSDGNLTQAEENIQAGLEILSVMAAEVPNHQQETLSNIITYLERALEELPKSEVKAADQLEGAWQLLVLGLPSNPDATESETPALTPTLTPTPNG